MGKSEGKFLNIKTLEEEVSKGGPFSSAGTSPEELQIDYKASMEIHPLYDVFLGAMKQAMYGKGERHGGCATPFMEQPWKHYADLHGRGFLTGQAAKKLEEAASTRNGQAFIDEMRGVLVYAGMAILKEMEIMKDEDSI